MDLRIPLSDMAYGVEEEEAVQKVIHSRWLTMGAITQEFERTFADLCGVKYAFGVANGTVALHLACMAAGIGPGDEVIVPALTFVATANAVLYTGAEVRFADIIGPDDLNISPEDIERKITPRTKAILVMHYGGYPCRMPEILAMAERHGLVVLEDAAHAPGASLDGRAMGAWGVAGCFSFFSNKNLAVGEGGMVVTDREDYAARLKALRSHGMTTLTWDRHHGHAFSYDVTTLGYNYRIDEIHSALGLAQLAKLEANNARRGAISAQYRAGLAGLDGVVTPFDKEAGKPSYHIFPMLLPTDSNRQVFMETMRGAGVQTSIHYPPIHHFSYYRERFPGITLPVTEDAAAREVTLPLYPGLSDEEVQYVLSSVREALVTARTKEIVARSES